MYTSLELHDCLRFLFDVILSIDVSMFGVFNFKYV